MLAKTALTVITAIIMPGGFVVLAIAFLAVTIARKRAKASRPQPSPPKQRLRPYARRSHRHA